jgi:uncharacterized protein
MRFNPRARLDRSQVQVRRGGGRGSGGRGSGMSLPIPTGGRGGGVGMVVLVVIVLVVLGLTGGLGGVLGGDGSSGAVTPRSADEPVSTSELTECETGEDANENPDCARLAVVNSIQSFWREALPEQTGEQYVDADTVIFTGSVDTGCGAADSSVGPFYCPTRDDMKVYLDTSFFSAMLEDQLGAKGGDFAEAYVLAHEYGHHIQNLTGQMQRVRTQSGPDSDAVRLELQADCYAGMWAHHATTADDGSGQPLITELTQQDIADALAAANTVGDDYIQERFQGTVTPESWTHGSSEQRQQWFTTGLETGDIAACDTFAASSL